jgi:hypothetical protein
MAGGGELFRPFPHGVLVDECPSGLCPERLERVKGLNPLSGSNTLPCASVTASFATLQEVSIRICDLLCELPFRIPAAAI